MLFRRWLIGVFLVCWNAVGPSAPADDEGFVSLFDGKTLAGWHAVPKECAPDWTVRDGAIVGHGSADRLAYLVWKDEQLTDFELKLRYRLPGKGNSGIEIRSQVVGWAEHAIYTQRVRNYSAKPIHLEVRRTFEGHTVFRSLLAATNHDYQTVQYTATVAAGQKADLLYEIVQLHGRLQKQDNVTIEKAEIAP